jgi:hypothetical protein
MELVRFVVHWHSVLRAVCSYATVNNSGVSNLWSLSINLQNNVENQYSLLGRTAASIRLNTTFRGLAPSPSSGKAVAREDYIESCRRESFKTYNVENPWASIMDCIHLGMDWIRDWWYTLINNRTANGVLCVLYFLCHMVSWYMCKCNFSHAHKKSMAFPLLMFVKLSGTMDRDFTVSKC